MESILDSLLSVSQITFLLLILKQVVFVMKVVEETKCQLLQKV